MKSKAAKKSYAVFGAGKFGRSIAEELTKAGAEVLVVDKDEEIVRELADVVTCAVVADVTDAATMETLGIGNMDGVVVAITGSLDASVMATIMAKEAGVPYIIAKSISDINSKILMKVGADKVIVPEKESGIRVARNMISGNFKDFIELSDRIRLVETDVKPEWVGKSLMELNLRRKYHINVVAIRKDGEVITRVDPELPLRNDISLFVTVDRSDIEKLTE